MAARDDELALLRAASEHEHDTLKDKVAGLEAKRAELRSAFDRINYLAAPARGQNRAAGEADAVVPRTTLLQARAQFEYLAREFIPLGDIASQVMCELGACTMDLALVAAQPADHLPVSEMARSILAPLGSSRT